MKKLLYYLILCFIIVSCGPSKKELTEMAKKNNQGFVTSWFSKVGEYRSSWFEVSVTDFKQVFEGDDEWDKNMMIIDSIAGLEDHNELVQSGEFFTPRGTLQIGAGWIPGWDGVSEDVADLIVNVEDLDLVFYRATVTMTTTINGDDGAVSTRGIKVGDMWKFDMLTAFTTVENPSGLDLRDPFEAFSSKELSDIYYKPVGSSKWIKNPYPEHTGLLTKGQIICGESFCQRFIDWNNNEAMYDMLKLSSYYDKYGIQKEWLFAQLPKDHQMRKELVVEKKKIVDLEGGGYEVNCRDYKLGGYGDNVSFVIRNCQTGVYETITPTDEGLNRLTSAEMPVMVSREGIQQNFKYKSCSRDTNGDGILDGNDSKCEFY
tara:strand:- start:418 stop:1539 length:1122 start_codon:yes stop_codon:yes gene_type:complete